MAPVEPGSLEPKTRPTHRNVAYGQSPNGEMSKGATGSHHGPQPDNAVRILLGGDVLDQIRRSGTNEGRDKTEVDVDFLLKGAEKLCGV